MRVPSIQRSIKGPATGLRVLLTVSGAIPDDIAHQVENGERPRPDYLELARMLDADVMDVVEARRQTGRLGRIIEKVAGPHAVLAWACYRARRDHDVVFTDGEQIGLPFALLCHITPGRRTWRHVMIGHLLSTRPKVLLFRSMRLGAQIDLVFVYSSWQERFLVSRLGYPADQVVRTNFMVDTKFFSRERTCITQTPMICAAGLEWRDYETLFEAVRDLDVRVVVAPASPWSRWADGSGRASVPKNVEIRRLGFSDLRALYAESAFVVLPLFDAEFQAGVTTLLEALAMERAVICSRSRGQTDVIVEGVTGLYVEPGDASGLRDAIVALCDDPLRAMRLGTAGRRYVEQECDVTTYARRLANQITRVAV